MLVLDGQEVGRILDEQLGDGGFVQPGFAQVGNEVFEEVVQGVALDARPSERAAVGVDARECLIQVAFAEEAQEVVKALLAGACPKRRVREFGLVAERVEADASTLFGNPGVTRLVGVHTVVDVPEQHPIQRQALVVEDFDCVLGVDSQVRQDRHAGAQRSASGRAVDALVQIRHPATPAHADLDDTGLAAGIADADGDLMNELTREVLDVCSFEERKCGVAADKAGARDDVDAGLGGQRLVVVDVTAVADSGDVDEGSAAVLVKFPKLGDGLGVPLLGGLPPLRVQLGARHAVPDVLVDGHDPEFLGGDRPQNGVHSRHNTHL